MSKVIKEIKDSHGNVIRRKVMTSFEGVDDMCQQEYKGECDVKNIFLPILYLES